MNSICIDENNQLVVKFEPTGNFSTDYFIEDFLNESDFTKNENDFSYKSEDIVEFKNRVKWTVDKFKKEFENNLEIWCLKCWSFSLFIPHNPKIQSLLLIKSS